MLVSVIIITLNEEENLESTILAVKEAARINSKEIIPVEIIVSDGGSNDQTIQIANKLADKVIIGPRGRYKQLNSGGRESRGNLLLFLHADTLLPEAGIIRIVNTLKDKRYLGGAFLKNWKWSADIERSSFIIFALWFWQKIGNWLVRAFKTFPGDNAMFVRRDVFNALSGYSPMWICEDFDFIKRIKRFCREHPVNTSKNHEFHQKITYVHQAVLTSTRRIENYGFFKTIILWFFIYCFWRLGMTQEQLKIRFHKYSTIPERSFRKYIRI